MERGFLANCSTPFPCPGFNAEYAERAAANKRVAPKESR